MLVELDVVDVLARAHAIERKTVADDLDHVCAAALCELVGGFARRKIAAVLDIAFDKLVCFEALFRLRDDAVVDVPAANVDDGIEVMRQGAELANLFTGEGHGKLTFCCYSVFLAIR